MSLAFVFPGQGSQKVGMGSALAAAFPEAAAVFEAAERALGDPLSKLCFEGPEEALQLTANTQPAVLTAVRMLARQAPRASEQQRPGWQQAAATDLTDRAAVAKARKDLAFLSGESPAWRQGAAALRVIRSALQAS